MQILLSIEESTSHTKWNRTSNQQLNKQFIKRIFPQYISIKDVKPKIPSETGRELQKWKLSFRLFIYFSLCEPAYHQKEVDLQRDLKLSSQSIFSSQQSTFVILYVLYTTLSKPHMWDYTGFFVVVVIVIFCCCCRHRLGLSPSKTDVSPFTCNSCGIIAYVFLYVDNIILTGTMTGSSLPLLLNWVAPSLLEYG